jgi:hypothetical protein
LKKSALDLPFDQYQRYRLAADLLDALRCNGEPHSVLDVGGRTALLRSFLGSDHLTLIDLEASDEERLVLGDGCSLPFRDDSFDVVAAFDTLEHVPPCARMSFIRDCTRVARKWVLLAGPYDAPKTVRAEELLAEFIEDKLGTHHRYLDEHRKNGLPSREETERILEQAGARVKSYGQANLDRWLAMMLLSMYLESDPALRKLSVAIHRFYNGTLYASDHAEPVYRHVVLASVNGTQPPEIDGLRAAPVAPAGVLEPFIEVTRELIAFDVARSRYEQEREDRERVIADLRLNQEGHEGTIGTLKSDLSEHAATLKSLEAVMQELRRDTAGMRAEFERDLEQHQLALQSELADGREHRKALASLERDLAGHREKTAALEALRQAEREEHAEMIAHRDLDLKGHRESLAQLELDLGEHKAKACALEAELDRNRRGTEGIRATLTADLNEHRETLNEHRETLKVVRAEIADHRRNMNLLEQELERERDERQQLRKLLDREREASLQVRAEVEADLNGHKQSLADMQRLMRSRWKNLKRALLGWRGPKPD